MNDDVKKYKQLGGTESSLQHYVMQRLQALEVQGRCYFFRNNSFAGRLTRWNGSQGIIRNNKPGTPDIVVCFHTVRTDGVHAVGITFGLFIGIEVKGPDGRQRPEQKIAQEAIEKAGGEYWLCRCPEEFEEKIKGMEL